MNTFPIVRLLTFFVPAALSLPSPDDGDGFRRSDLFLENNFFLGIPEVADNMGFDSLGLNVDSDSSLTYDQLALQGRLLAGKKEQKPLAGRASKWPSRQKQKPLQNAGVDVIKAFQENLNKQKQNIGGGDIESAASSIAEEIIHCEKLCPGLESLPKQSTCILNCVTENKEILSELSEVIYLSIKTLCETVNTFYSDFAKHQVKSFATLRAVMNRVESPVPVSSNVPLRAMLAKLINNVFSAMAPLRPLLAKFEEDLLALESYLNLKQNVLLGANPGCSMVDMKEAIQIVIGIILKDPSLADYIMLQGYGLFTSLTKYVDEFPTKKEFSVLNQGLDMVLGTTCGLLMYGEKGETPDCDQFGGFPVLNMPVPEFMWPLDVHKACERTKAQMLVNKEKEKKSARGKRENSAAAMAVVSAEEMEAESLVATETETLTTKIRRRRSLVVGRK